MVSASVKTSPWVPRTDCAKTIFAPYFSATDSITFNRFQRRSNDFSQKSLENRVFAQSAQGTQGMFSPKHSPSSHRPFRSELWKKRLQKCVFMGGRDIFASLLIHLTSFAVVFLPHSRVLPGYFCNGLLGKLNYCSGQVPH